MRFNEINPFPTLFTIEPSNRDHEVAVRCGISVLVPLLVLLAIGRIDLSIFACFGAFTAIYGRSFEQGVRLQSHVRAGSLMFVVIVLATLAGRAGISEQDAPWVLVGLTSVVAGLASVIVAYWDLRPAGALFQIFAFAAIASVSTQPPFLDVVATAGGTILFSFVVAMGSRVLFPSSRRPFVWPKRREIPASTQRIYRLEGLGFFLAAGCAGTIATLLGPTLGMTHMYWAMVGSFRWWVTRQDIGSLAGCNASSAPPLGSE